MSQTMTLAPTSPTALSPAFGLARKLSWVMAVFFALAFCLFAGTLVLMSLDVIFFHSPNRALGLPPGIRINWDGMHGWARFGAMVAADFVLLPTILILYHMGRLFLCFARGEVFAARPIAHMRAAGLWLIASFFMTIAAVLLLNFLGVQNILFPLHLYFVRSLLGLMLTGKGSALLMGIPITIAAYVMEEARRIAADHAEIV